MSHYVFFLAYMEPFIIKEASFLFTPALDEFSQCWYYLHMSAHLAIIALGVCEAFLRKAANSKLKTAVSGFEQGNRQQATGNRQQATGNRQQAIRQSGIRHQAIIHTF
jgi:hypothetical protein